jgi:hypothetical protein
MVTEDLFRFVTIRDPQRAPRQSLLRAMTYDPAANTKLHNRLRAVSGNPQKVRAVADAFAASKDFMGSLEKAPNVVQLVDRTLLLMEGDNSRGGDELVAVVIADLRLLADDNDGSRSLSDLLKSAQVHEQWRLAADSFLAITFASSAPPSCVVDLSRMLVIWALLERLGQQATVSSEDLDALVRDAVVIIPGDVFLIAGDTTGPGTAPRPRTREEPDEPTPSSSREASGKSEALARYMRLTAAAKELRAALFGTGGEDIHVIPAPIVSTDGPSVATWRHIKDLTGLSRPTRAVLADFSTDSVPETMLTIDAAADRALSEHAAAQELGNRDAFRRRAITLELHRRRLAPLAADDKPFPVVLINNHEAVSQARLLSPPVVGELKVVRQTLAGYELGEIAHVENVLEGEHKVRRHRVIDVTELEAIQTEQREQEHEHDLQTTMRSELATETQSTVQRDESSNAGGTITASYGPYFSASATVGVAQSKAQSEANRASSRFAQDITERASDHLRTRTENVRRSLTRNTISEENIHRLDGAEGNTVGVYRWVNKRYCAQIYNYGLRVLLDVGVMDPSAGYRYAEQVGADLDVDADPPPELVLPGTNTPLVPQIIGSANWQTLAATFRVADFPPPPAFWVATPFAWSHETPQQQAPPPSSQAAPGSQPGVDRGGTPPPPSNPRLFKSSREITLPGGYLPIRFVASVLVDGPSGLYGDRLSDAERQILRAVFEIDVAKAPNAAQRNRLREVIEMWLAWEPSVMPKPDLSLDDLRLLNRYILPGIEPGPRREGLLAFMASAVGGFRPGLELAVGPVLTWAPRGPTRSAEHSNTDRQGSRLK